MKDENVFIIFSHLNRLRNKKIYYRFRELAE